MGGTLASRAILHQNALYTTFAETLGPTRGLSGARSAERKPRETGAYPQLVSSLRLGFASLSTTLAPLAQRPRAPHARSMGPARPTAAERPRPTPTFGSRELPSLGLRKVGELCGT